MKKFANLMIFIIIGFCLVACAEHENVTNNESDYMNVADFAFVGDLHNSIMTQVNNNIPVNEIVKNSTNEDEAVELVADFIDKEINQYHGDEVSGYCTVDMYRNFLKSEDFVNAIFRETTRNEISTDEVLSEMKEISNSNVIMLENLPSLTSMIYALRAENIISEKSASFLNRITESMIRNYQGLVSDAEFERQVH